ncbi:YojF family protein [Fictibacillus phosphorivorans]|uniref:YojF family protein n=1 Tax=Fictibacillus phosphorivorans TaxID=1221500 RepID=UPI00203BA830|nr:YojF family protein [Fictibacillus phosphorivorans]MCM3719946.1 YojF family protein [Fictibacillus phosphorivorans]MCM3777600.1 YojF family protein [Fictibacillus phosphorivorans]
MQPIQANDVQHALDQFIGKELYLHLETTNGAYANHNNESVLTVNAYIRNGKVTPLSGKIMGDGPFRVGLKIELGWIYAEGLTHWEIDSEGKLLLAGHDQEGRLAVALQLSTSPFDV